jgi:polar amino acid transport system permease protein
MSAPAAAVPAAHGRRRRRVLWVALTVLAAAALYVLAAYVIDWPDWAEPVWRYIIEEGLPGTLRVSAVSVVGSCLIGVVLGTLLTIRFAPTRVLIRGYIEVFRGLPILVTVFIVYFGLPAVAPVLEFGPLTAASIALVLWGSAQVAEATRGAVQSIPREQHEAASALGFGWVGRHGNVILPQALRRLLPPLVGLLVNIIQNSTLAQVIGGLEILEAAERQNERLTAVPPIGLGEIHAFEIFGAVMVLFFVISFPLTRLAAMLERRLI